MREKGERVGLSIPRCSDAWPGPGERALDTSTLRCRPVSDGAKQKGPGETKRESGSSEMKEMYERRKLVLQSIRCDSGDMWS